MNNTIEGVKLVLDTPNIDTDQIIPARFLTTVTKKNLGENLFADSDKWPPKQQGNILIAGDNFGCGSSREHAVWALMDYGIKAVLAPSFGSIFRKNSALCGLLLVKLAPEEISVLFKTSDNSITINIETAQVRCGHFSSVGTVDPMNQICLLQKKDPLDLLMDNKAAAEAFEERKLQNEPWQRTFRELPRCF